MQTPATNLRKHVTQMSDREITHVESLVRSLGAIRGLSDTHISQRMQQWAVSENEVMRAIRTGDIVEVHANNAPDVRAVIRATVGTRDVCVCISLKTRTVITVWVNTSDDNHATLRLNEYCWRVNLASLTVN